MKYFCENDNYLERQLIRKPKNTFASIMFAVKSFCLEEKFAKKLLILRANLKFNKKWLTTEIVILVYFVVKQGVFPSADILVRLVQCLFFYCFH